MFGRSVFLSYVKLWVFKFETQTHTLMNKRAMPGDFNVFFSLFCFGFCGANGNFLIYVYGWKFVLSFGFINRNLELKWKKQKRNQWYQEGKKTTTHEVWNPRDHTALTYTFYVILQNVYLLSAHYSITILPFLPLFQLKSTFCTLISTFTNRTLSTELTREGGSGQTLRKEWELKINVRNQAIVTKGIAYLNKGTIRKHKLDTYARKKETSEWRMKKIYTVSYGW